MLGRLRLASVLVLAAVAGVCTSSIHLAAATPTGLVAAYSFDEGSGATAADLSGNGNAATLSGATWSTSGKYGGAAQLNGTSGLVTVPDSPSLDLSSGMTLEAWVRPTSFGASQTLIAKERPGGGFPYGLELDNGLPTAYANTGTFGSAGGASALPTATWSFVAATYDGSILRVYVGTTIVASAALSGSVAQSNGGLSLGGDSVWGEYFAGRIDNVRVYKRALAASELQSDMNAAVALPPAPAPTPAAAYAFDEGAGSSAADASGNANNASLTGAGWTSAGKWGAAATFNGTSSIVKAPDSASLDATSGLTLEAWVKPSSFAAAQTIVAKERPGGGFPYGLELDNGVPSAYVAAGTNAVARGSAALPTGTWTFLAATFDGAALTLYVNGTAVSSASVTGSLTTSTGTLSIGADAAWGEYFAGTIDNVRVYARALTAAQLATDMGTPVGGAAPPPPPPTTTTTTTTTTPPPTGGKVPCSGRSFYVDYAAGSDASSGTSTGSPWKRAPGMVGFAGSYTRQAHDCFYFKGGVTWPRSLFPFAPGGGGDASGDTYYGPDPNWFAGGSWSRPRFDLAGTNVAGGRNVVVDLTGSDRTTLDGFAIANYAASGWTSGYGTCAVIMIVGDQHVTLDNLDVSNFVIDNASDKNGCPLVQGATYAPYAGESVVRDSTFAGGPNSLGGGILCVGTVQNVVMHDTTGMIFPCGHGEISGNLLYNCGYPSFPPGVTSEHADAIQVDAADGAFLIHDNVIHDTGSDSNGNECESMLIGNAGETDYVWNNVVYNIHGNSIALVQNASVGKAAYIWNNTITGGQDGSGYCVRAGHGGTWPTLVIQNNHCVSTAGRVDDPALSASSKAVDHNVVQTPAAASAAGFSASSPFAYAPTKATAATVGAGANLASSCSGALASLCADTAYAGLRAPVARPGAGAWDAGAYAYR